MPDKSHSFNVARTTEISKELLTLLDSTVLGTPGKLRYKHIDVASTLRSLNNLEFIQIKKQSRVLGTAGFIHRSTKHESENLDTLYVRYLSVFNPLKRQVKNVHVKSPNKNRKAGLREEILGIFKEELERPFYKSGSKGLYYAFVEADNILSRNLCKSFGFKAHRKVSTYLFSRFTPKKFTEIRELTPDEYSLFRKEIRGYYNQHALFFEDEFTPKSRLFGYFEEGELIAGLRAFPVNWKIVEVPGFSGFLMQKLLPYLPYFKSIFNPDKLNFLAFDHIWSHSNKESTISKLMEHSCASLNINMGMTWIDTACTLSNYFSQHAKLGFLHRINGVVKADLMTRSILMDSDEQQELLSKPIFISAVDMT